MMNKSIAPITHRHSGIDLVKTIAIFGVIVIHISASSFLDPIGSVSWLSSLAWASISRASVPLFLMCTGALMLQPEKQLSLKKLFFHNLLRIVIAMIVWGIFYKVYHLVDEDRLSLHALLYGVAEVLLFNQEMHFYYLHMTILIYLLLPFLRVFAANATKKQMEYTLLVLVILGTVLPILRMFWPFSVIKGIPLQWIPNLAFFSVGLTLVGSYLRRYPLPVGWSVGIALVGLSGIFLLTWYGSSKAGSLDTTWFGGNTLPVTLYAAGVFSLCMHVSEFRCKAIGRTVQWVSGASFCIYLVHIFYLKMLYKYELRPSRFYTGLSIPTITLIVAALSALTYWIISKIPGVRKYLT